MADNGLWHTICGVAEAAGETIKQVVSPTKSTREIELRQKAREAEAGDAYSAALEKLAGRDQTKVQAGKTLLESL